MNDYTMGDLVSASRRHSWHEVALIPGVRWAIVNSRNGWRDRTADLASARTPTN